jgi:hypothetical protein
MGQFRSKKNENRWNIEPLFRREISQIFVDNFRTVPAKKHRNLLGKIRTISDWNTVSMFQRFPEGHGDFAASLL